MSRDILTPDRREMIALSAAAATGLLMTCGASAAIQPVEKPLSGMKIGRDQPFNDGWLFQRGTGDGFETAALSDVAWRSLDLPHDWSIENIAEGEAVGPFIKTAPGGVSTGFSLGGEGWYRKHFRLPIMASDVSVQLRFDGVYGECDVWLNEAHLHHNWNGYAPFSVDLTPRLKRDGDNLLVLCVRNLGRNSRWYSGSGIYRQVTLDIVPSAARIARDGIYAWTKRLTKGTAEIAVVTELEGAFAGMTLITRLRNAKGRVVAEAISSTTAKTSQNLSVPGPHLWSVTKPYLHNLETELRLGDRVIDRVSLNFGIRVVSVTADRGLVINGEHVLLRGACIHHDNGLLGSCAFRDADERKVLKLKQRGFNAIRSSHNPASHSLRTACDRHGMLLIEEAFDMWHRHKLPDDYAAHFASDWEQSLQAMVRAARNSPSVIMWSIGNEVPGRSDMEGRKWAWTLANAVHRLDPTRPVTAALNGVLGPLIKADSATARAGKAGQADNVSTVFLDIAGYNYRLDDIERDHRAHPDRLIFASETYPRDVYDYWQLGKRASYFLGEFVWTAMDYLGEAGIGATVTLPNGSPPTYSPAWPWVISWCGDLDLICDQKAQSLFRDVVWGISPLEIVVQRPIPEGQYQYVGLWAWPDELPSWTWAGHEGKPITVCVYSSAGQVDLLLNGTLIASRTLVDKDKMRAEFVLPYKPGKLEAVAWSGAKVLGRKQLVTVGVPTKLALRPEVHLWKSETKSLCYVDIDIVDAQGHVIPDEARKLSLVIDGPAKLVGFGSGNPFASGSLQSNATTSFRGRALAILRGYGHSGSVRVTVKSEELESASTLIRLVG